MRSIQSQSNTPNKNRNSMRKKPTPKKEPSKLQRTWESIDFDKLRYQFVASIFICIWGILWFRTFYLQVVTGQELRNQSTKQHSITQLVEAKRGNIYDRNGQILARSVEARSVYAHPRQISDAFYAAKTLSPILNIPEEKLIKQFQQDRSFIWVSRKVDDATASAIQNSGIAGIGLSTEYERVYPYKHLAGQLLGFVGIDNDGLEGIERAFNETLTGNSQKQIIPRDIAGRALYSIDDSETKGEDIKLTLDVQIQFIAEEVIAEAVETYEAKWGGVLVVDPKTGDLLAWAQYPFFNPNNFRNYSPNIYRNRLANDALEPGSTFKPLVVAAALEEGTITPETTFFCEDGVWAIDHIKIGKDKHAFTIGDDGRSYQDLTAEEILVYSSNIGMAKMAQALGSEKLRDYLLDLGFGQHTGLGINESKGIIRRLRDWSEADLLSTGFGQSVATTPLQLIQAYNILVNDGERTKLNILKDDQTYNPHVAEQNIFSRKNARTVLNMMESVVDGNGTGKRARIEGVRVAGKTGTAQKAGTGEIGYGEARMASFIGVIPADNPRYIILTILDEPTVQSYGGRIAAPVFQKVGVRTMAYSGDLPGVVFPQEASIVARQNSPQKEEKVDIQEGFVPDVNNLSLRKAIEAFEQIGVIPKIIGKGTHVLKQVPPAGSPLYGLVEKKQEEAQGSVEENTSQQPKDNTEIIPIHYEYELYLHDPSKIVPVNTEESKTEKPTAPENVKEDNKEKS